MSVNLSGYNMTWLKYIQHWPKDFNYFDLNIAHILYMYIKMYGNFSYVAPTLFQDKLLLE